jgi:hypothetical protein
VSRSRSHTPPWLMWTCKAWPNVVQVKPEYDFTKGERGKFFRPDAETRVPIYLDAEVQSYLAERATAKGMDLGEMVNGLLKQEIQIIESVK